MIRITLFYLAVAFHLSVDANDAFSSVEKVSTTDDKKPSVDFSMIEDFDPFISETDIPNDIKEILSTDALPDLTSELVVQFLLENSPQKPEWIFAKKLLQEKERAAQARKVKKYTNSQPNVVIPFAAKSVSNEISLEPLKFSIIEIIDANGKPWPITMAKSSNDSFVVLSDQDISPEQKSSMNHIIIRPNEDYQDGNLLVMLDGYEYPLKIKLRTGNIKVNDVTTLKVLSSVKTEMTNNKSSEPTQLVSHEELRNFFIDAPETAKVVPVKGDGVEVFYDEGFFYILTMYQINTPYTAVEYGSGGMKVYKVSPDSILDSLAFTYKGQLITVDLLLEDV